jgi:hypothetical protein
MADDENPTTTSQVRLLTKQLAQEKHLMLQKETINQNLTADLHRLEAELDAALGEKNASKKKMKKLSRRLKKVQGV